MLTELEAAPTAAVTVTEFTDHLRLSTGLAAPQASEVAALDGYLRAAGAAVESMTGRALIQRRFKWAVERWRNPCREVLPIAPVAQINAVTLLAADGSWTAVDPSAWRLVKSQFDPALVPVRGGWLPQIPTGGVAEIELLAGHGVGTDGVPHELRQAVLLLAAHYHEQRHVGASGTVEIPYGVGALVSRWRKVRV
ncbi:MAG: putative phiE125 gp8 family phage protein [Paracoccaceae bacterium]|jgi:uncharacterized phiE125 gp8 family phage protein